MRAGDVTGWLKNPCPANCSALEMSLAGGVYTQFTAALSSFSWNLASVSSPVKSGEEMGDYINFHWGCTLCLGVHLSVPPPESKRRVLSALCHPGHPLQPQLRGPNHFWGKNRMILALQGKTVFVILPMSYHWQ